MKRLTLAAVMLAGVLAFAGCTTGRYAQYSRPHPLGTDSLSQMHKADVIKLSKAGVSDSLIVSMIDVTDSWFDLKTQDVVDLKHAGVSEKVIDAMIATNVPQPNSRREYYADYPYYWYSGFYPYWYYPSFSFGYYYYRPFHFHRYAYPFPAHYWNYGTRSGVRTSGRHR